MCSRIVQHLNQYSNFKSIVLEARYKMEYVISDPELKQIQDEIYDSLFMEYKKELIGILEEKDDMPSYAVNVSFGTLNFLCPKTTDLLMWKPEAVFPEADKTTMKVMSELFELEKTNNHKLSLKKNVHYRLRSNSFPSQSRFYRHQFPDCEERGMYMVLVGTVTAVKPASFLEFQKPYQCSVCKAIVKIKGKASKYYRYPGLVKQDCMNGCENAKFKLVKRSDAEGEQTKTDFMDYQEIKIQENVRGNNFGVNSKCYVVALEEDLINSCKQGDDVCIGGWIFLRHQEFKKDTKMEIQAVFKANHIVVTNADQRNLVPTFEQKKMFKAFWNAHKKDPFAGRDEIVKSFCPEICGMYPVKLGALVALIGGVEKKDKETKTARAQSHIILIGDPGTGKSQILQYCVKLIPRSVCTTGAGSSVAGLTVGAVKSGDAWDLHPGALVLADSGICCIDEFSLLNKRESGSIHEAMEQQTISVAKAGIICKIKTSCNVISASNPKKMTKKADNTYEVDIGMSSPLLSRFDLVMLLADEHNPEFDERLCDFVLGLCQNMSNEIPGWDIETLRAYIGHVKKLQVQMSEEIGNLLRVYYNYQRKTQTERGVRVTARLLQSLIRLSEGHARLMYRRHVLVSDAVMAITLMEHSLYSTGLLRTKTNSVTHVPFPADPMKTYQDNAKTFLEALGLSNIWKEESRWLCSLSMNNTSCSSNAESRSWSFTDMTQQDTSHNNDMVSQEQSDWFRSASKIDGSIKLCSSNSSISIIPASFPFLSSDMDISVIEPPSPKRAKK